MDFAGLEKLRIPKAIAKPPESLESLLDSLENVEQTRTIRKRTTPKGNAGNIEDATQLQKAKNT